MTAVGWVIHDSGVVAQRHLKRVRRVPQMLFFSMIQPIMLLLLFAFVFSQAIAVDGLDYKTFMLPGVFVQAMGFSAGSTAVGLAEEMRNGMNDRLRSMPVHQSASLLGRMLFDGVRNLIAVTVLLVVGLAIGFRFGNGVLQVLGGVGMLIVFSFAVSSFAAAIGLSAPSPEVAQMKMIAIAFPLVFASSAYVPLGSLPGWMEAWTQYSPITMVVDSIRVLFTGYGDYSSIVPALIWCAAIAAVCLPLAVRSYKRAVST